MLDICLEKKFIRTVMREKRKNMAAASVRELSRSAQGHILADSAWVKAASVGLYVAVRNEVGTDLLQQKAWEAGKQVFLPFIPKGEDGHMCFVPCAPEDILCKNCYGIPEPVPPRILEDHVPEIIIVPGLAFDRNGGRVGSGGGYYDRFFAGKQRRNALRVGLAYAFQVLDDAPCEGWDFRMNALATEDGIAWMQI